MVFGMDGRNGAGGQFQVKMKVMGRPRRRQGQMKIVPYTIRVRGQVEGYRNDEEEGASWRSAGT